VSSDASRVSRDTDELAERREARELAKHARHVMHAELQAGIAQEIRVRQSAARVVDALEMQAAIDVVRGGPLRLEDSRDLADVSRIAIARGAQLLEDLASNAPDWDTRAKAAHWLLQDGIELRRLELERLGSVATQSQITAQLSAAAIPPAVLEQFGEQLTEVLQQRRKLAARGG